MKEELFDSEKSVIDVASHKFITDLWNDIANIQNKNNLNDEQKKSNGVRFLHFIINKSPILDEEEKKEYQTLLRETCIDFGYENEFVEKNPIYKNALNLSKILDADEDFLASDAVMLNSIGIETVPSQTQIYNNLGPKFHEICTALASIITADSSIEIDVDAAVIKCIDKAFYPDSEENEVNQSQR